MNTLKILSQQEKQEILEKLNEQFGIKEMQGTILKFGEEKLFLFQGSLTEPQIKKLEQIIPIERVGIYFAKIQEGQIRLSIEGTYLLKNQITKNIFEINEEQAEQWMMGQEILLDDINESNKKELINNDETISKGFDELKKDELTNDKTISNSHEKNLIIKKKSISSEVRQTLGWVGKKSVDKKPKGFAIIKFKDDFLGCGKASEHKITNFIPKNRRLKKTNQ